jgi:4,4'-diaponeurosporenoate glycosyltransferase
MWLYLVGWGLGWLMLARPRPLASRTATATATATATGTRSGAERPAIAVIIPARDEESSLPHLLAPLAAQLRTGDELIVVDDGSTDSTGTVAAAQGARVVHPPILDVAEWMGKPNACLAGARVSTAPLLLFVDADVVPPADLLDRVADTLTQYPASVVSVQPWHRSVAWYEQLSLLGNLVSMMGSGGFTPLGRRLAATLAFGPVLAVDRVAYDRVGGHGHPMVRRTRVEDIALARAVGRSELFSGHPDIWFRMYPGGIRELIDGWTRNMSAGIAATPWWIGVMVGAWVSSVAGGWLAWPWAYPLTAVQLWVLGRRVGSFRLVTAALFPLVTVVFVGVVIRSLVLRAAHRSIGWKGRRIVP